MCETPGELRVRARAAFAEGRVEASIALCRDAVAFLSAWEHADHEARVHELERLAPAYLGARVDLRKLRADYVPHAPVLACECEEYDYRYARSFTYTVTKREQATLRRIKRALGSAVPKP
jgi:hypothetical protein